MACIAMSKVVWFRNNLLAPAVPSGPWKKKLDATLDEFLRDLGETHNYIVMAYIVMAYIVMAL